MSVQNINKEIIVTDCLTGMIIARFPYDISNTQETFKDVLYYLVYRNFENGVIIRVN